MLAWVHLALSSVARPDGFAPVGAERTESASHASSQVIVEQVKKRCNSTVLWLMRPQYKSAVPRVKNVVPCRDWLRDLRKHLQEADPEANRGTMPVTVVKRRALSLLVRLLFIEDEPILEQKSSPVFLPLLGVLLEATVRAIIHVAHALEL